MAEDIQSNIRVNIETTDALSNIKNLQRQLSAFHTALAKGSADATTASRNLQQNLINNINATGKFTAQISRVKTTTESFTNALEKNKLSMGEYFRYAGGASKSFGRLFRSEFETINKVARERVKDLQTQYIKLGRDANGAMQAIKIRPLALDMDNLATKTAIAAQRQQLLNQLLKQGSTNLLNFGKNTQWAGRQLMVGFTIPLTIFGSTAAKSFMAMEEQAIKFKRVYGDMLTTGPETDKMLNQVKELAKEFTRYGVAAEKTMGLAAQAAASGKQGADLLAQVSEASRLSVLGQVEQEQALQTTISVTNAFGTAAENLANKIDFLNAVENQTVTSIEDLTIAIPKAGPVVKQLGGDVEDLAFFLTAMREGGINASEGANALKSGLASLINPTAKASEFMMGFGINIKKIVEANRGDIKGIVVDFATALDGLDPLARARAIEQLFGKFQFSRLSTLFQNVIGQGTQAQRVLDLAGQTTQQLAALSTQELNKVSESPMYKFKKAVEDIKIALAPIGEQFLKIATPVVEFGTKILEAFNRLDEKTRSFVLGLVAVVGGIGPVLLMTFGLLANGIANIIKGFTAVKSLFNRVGQSSNDLGSRVNYMTQEQIEAAAVASSLDQVHMRLSQTFTSEAAAVNQLTDALQRAVNAQKAFGGTSIVGRGPNKPKKYANGVVSVPGSGKGDKVPAMLEPGEAVIPGAMAKKYGPLIGGMIADNIPGYRKGKIGSGASGRVGKSQVTVQRGFGENTKSTQGLVDFVAIDPTDLADLTSIYMSKIIKEADISVSAINDEVMGWREANIDAINKATEQVNAGAPSATAYGPLVEKFNNDMEAAQGPVSKLADTARAMAPQLEKDLREAQDYARKFNLNIKQSAADAQALAEALPNNQVATGAAKAGNYGNLSKARQATSAMFGGAAGISTYGSPRIMLAGGEHPSSAAYKGASSQEHFSTTLKQEMNQMKLAAQRVIASQANAFGQELVNAAAVRSPSRKTKKAAEGMVDGVLVAIKEGESKAKQAGKKIVDAVVSGTVAGGKPTQASNVQGGVPLSTVQNVGRTKSRLGGLIAGGMKVDTVTGNLDRLNSIIMNSSFALTALAGAGSMAGGMIGELANTVFQYSGALYSLMAITQLATQSKIAEIAANRAANAGLLVQDINTKAFKATPGMFAGGIKQLLPNLAKFGGAIVRFLGPIGMTVGAFSLLAGVAKMVADANERQRDKIEGLGNAANMATDKIGKLVNVFGLKTVTTPFEQKFAAPTATSNKQKDAVDQILKTESFAKDYAKEIEAIKNASVSQAESTLQAMATKIVGITPGIAEDQVNAIIMAVQAAAGRRDLNVQFSSINLQTKSGMAGMKAVAESNINDLAFELQRGRQVIEEQITYYDELGGSSGSGLVTKIIDSDALKAQFDKSANSMVAFMTGISGQFKSGLINAQQFSQSFDSVAGAINKLKTEAQKAEFMKKMFDNMPEGAAKAVAGIKKLGDQLLVMKAIASGVIEITPVMMNTLNSDTPAANRVRRKLNKDVANLQKIFDKLNPTAPTPSTSTSTGTKKETPYEAAIKQLKQQRTEATNTATAYKRLTGVGYSAAEAFKLAKDPILAAGLAAAKVKPGTKAWNELLALIKKTKKEIEGAEALDPMSVFEKGFGMKMEQITAKETEIELKFKTDTKSYSDAVTEAENAIEEKRNKAGGQDDLEAGLKRLGFEEDKINQKYDKRVAAITAVERINAQVANRQKAQLDVADAITRGDIAAAARAVQESKREQAALQTEDLNKALEASREKELVGLTTVVNGVKLSRIQIEEQLRAIEIEILDLEEKKLEPARESIRLAEVAKQTKLDALAAEKAEWEKLKNAIDLAKTSSKEYLDAILAAKAAQPGAVAQAQGLGAAVITPKVEEPPKDENAGKKDGNVVKTAPVVTDVAPGPGVGMVVDGKEVLSAKELQTNEGLQKAVDITKNQIADNAKQVAKVQTSSGSAAAKEKELKKLADEKAGLLYQQHMAGLSLAMKAVAKPAAKPVAKKAPPQAIRALLRSKGGPVGYFAKGTKGAIARTKGTKGPISRPQRQPSIFEKIGSAIMSKSKSNGMATAVMPNVPQIGFIPKASDRIPAMLTPGEFIISKPAVDKIGTDKLKDINAGKNPYGAASVYNYDISVNVRTNADANDIAKVVLAQIKQVDSQRLRSNRF